MSTNQPSTARVVIEVDRAEIGAILAEELAEVTPAMLDAGSKAAEIASVEWRSDSRGRRHREPRMTSEADHLTGIWRAMLAAKLGGAA